MLTTGFLEILVLRPNLAGNSPFPLKAPILGGRFEKGRV